MMTEYKSLDSFEINGRGTVYVINAPMEFDRNNCPLIGKTIIMDGEKREVKAIESYCIPTISKGTKIGLLLK